MLEITSRVSTAEISNSSPLSAINDKRLLQILQDENAYTETNRYSFAGENAKTADHSLLAKAKSAVENGKNPEIVRQQTGWFKGKDDKWRFEIDDSEVRFLDKDIEIGADLFYLLGSRIHKLRHVIQADALFSAYPELKDVGIKASNLEGNNSGYSRSQNLIYLDRNLSGEQAKSILLHEIQHIIQYIEDFAYGTNLQEASGKTEKELAIRKYEKLRSEASPQLVEAFDAFLTSESEYLLDEENQQLGEKYTRHYEDLVRNHIGGFDLFNAYEQMNSSTDDPVPPLEVYRKTAGEVEARNVQTRMNMRAEERLNRSPESTEDVKRENQIVRYADGAIANSLNEAPNSDFARAVDEVVNGNVPQGRISMGTTPDVLKMLGLPKTQIRITGAVIQKVMGEYLGIDGSGHSHIHNLTPDTLKQLPKQINNPVAVFKSSTKENSYVVLTELNELDRRTGKHKPVVSALHINVGKGNVEVIDVRSVYGRSDNQLVTAFREDLLYLNKAKGQQFLKTHPLQLHWDLTSDANLSASNIKTETDLSQYQSAKNQPSSIDTQKFKQILTKAVGESAVKNIDVIQSGTKPDGVQQLITADVEGWFNPRTGRITLVADGIRATPTMTREERIAWVGWHELAHRGVNVRLKGEYKSIMHRADSHPLINAVATEIQQERKGKQDGAADNRHLAVEEALAEVFAAYQTGNFNELAARYGVKMSDMGFKAWLRKFADKVRALIDKLFGRETAEKFSDTDLVNLMSEIKRGIHGESAIKNQGVFFSTQSKSATDNNSGFDRNNEDIRSSRRPKSESLEKLRRAETIRISGREIEPSEDLRQYRRNVMEYGKTLRGSYINKDTGQEIDLSRASITEVLHHDLNKPEHLQSIAAIPQIIENATYISTLPNEDFAKNPAVREYEYYVAGLNIGGGDYTVKAAVGVGKDGSRYYDHKLTKIEKGKLLSLLDRLSDAGASEANSPLSVVNDKRLLQILQDENAYTETNRYSFAGENAKTADHSLLAKAKSAVENGKNPEIVRQQTGWFKGVDDKWRFEIDDSQISFKRDWDKSVNAMGVISATEYQKGYGAVATLGDILNAPELFAAYPDITRIPVSVNYDPNYGGGYNPAEDKITISSGYNLAQTKSVLLHEIQHAIQERENFARGAATTSPNYDEHAGEVEARNVQIRLKMDKQARLNHSPESTEDTPRGIQIISYDYGIANSLNEAPNSDFARAVDKVANNEPVKGKYINVGTTPKVLQMIGLPDVNVDVSVDVLNKVMGEKHNITADTLKQLPSQINNPVAVMKSDSNSSNPNGYVVLTELLGKDTLTGKNKPVIAALHLKETRSGIELINIASVYGRSNSQIQRGLENDLLYWNKEKGRHFINRLGLQLSPRLGSSNNLSISNVKTETDLSQYEQQNNSSEIRFSRSQSALDLARTGKAKADSSLWEDLKARDFAAVKKRFNELAGKIDETFADSLRPVNDWIDQMQFSEHTGQFNGRNHEKRRLKDAMYAAKGKRDALNSELEQRFLKPLLKELAAIAKKTKGKDEKDVKALVGTWLSTRYSIEKNAELLQIDEQAMLEAEQKRDELKAQGAGVEEIHQAELAYRKAAKQYWGRKADVESRDFSNDRKYQVGVAGGWSVPLAREIMKEIEAKIPKAALEKVGDLVADLNQARLEIDRDSGRYTEAEYQRYKQNRHYVPLTGDPTAEEGFDFIAGAGGNAVNISTDRGTKGRTGSEADDAITTIWEAVGKTTTYKGWSEFKNKIDDLFETEVTLLKEQGYSEQEARTKVKENLGIGKRRMQGLTRTSDNVLIAKRGGVYYEYSLPDTVMNALKADNVENANAFLKVLSKPTSWYARGVTQWTVTFAPINMLRDTWEKSEFIRVQKLYDKDGKLLDSKTMDNIGRALLGNALFNPSKL